MFWTKIILEQKASINQRKRQLKANRLALVSEENEKNDENDN